ncbi:ribose transport system ATP-binding protein [Rhizobium azooxidifex]|uniref:Ribose transport system ATP-binding protein n=2 Tax=Mycoplana azooxidifex TaxID=1636188 RepID=A0A7W6DFZ0_9HYPH|nr:ribose transport system ATP-binding protein [Mycoplana azooxidifex]
MEEMRDELLLVMLIAVAVACFSFARPTFFSVSNLLSIGQQSSIVAIVALGMTGVIVARGIDISVGGTMAATGIIAAIVLQATGSGVLAILAAIGSGAAFGGLNALLVAGLGISPFIATLGTMALTKGAALSLSGAASIPVSDPFMLWLGQGSLAGVPAGFLLAVALCGVWLCFLRYTSHGRSFFAVGGNPVAARASLISVVGIRSLTYVLAGMSAGTATVIAIGRLGSAQPLAGNGLEFAAITAAVVGGASLSGGKGSPFGTLLGAIAVGTITAGLAFLQFSQQIVYMVSGGLILVAVLLRGDLSWSALVRTASPGAVSLTSRGDETCLLDVAGLTKQFSGIKVLNDVSFRLRGGEVVALLGENGAGKSTLVKCISGVYVPDGGRVQFGALPKEAFAEDGADIAVIHQHFSLVPDLTIAESLSLGNEPQSFGLLKRSSMRSKAKAALSEVGLTRDVDVPVRLLTVGERQMLEVAKALLSSARLIVMDEPTSALSNRERDRLYTIVRKLAGEGRCVLYISHKMEEVRELAGRAIVLRDGRMVGDVPMQEADDRALVHMMVGRSLENVFPWVEAPLGPVAIEVKGLRTSGLVADVSFSVRRGEVVGLAGLMGSGRTDILRCIAGLDPYASGEIRLHGDRMSTGAQGFASSKGVAFVPEDRRLEGLVGGMNVRDNLALVWMRRGSKFGLVSLATLRRNAAALIRQLDIRPPDPGKPAGTLSGGNQQKVVIGKWLAVNPSIILLDEPTSGVDVGAKSEIHSVIGKLKSEGAAILLVSSELPELLGVSDRVVVVSGGRSVGEMPRGTSEEAVMELAFSTTPKSSSNRSEVCR